MNDVDVLFRPFEHKTLSLRNRVAMAPMTRSHSPGGTPGDDVVAYYERRAAAEVGLIITEGTTIDHPVATADNDVPRFHGEAPLAGWKRVVDAVHGAGGVIVPQLWHVGMSRKPGTEPYPDMPSIGPSGLVKGKKKGTAATEDDIAALIAAFASAAASAKALGFDGVELHGAHGYLIDQFLWKVTNARDDRYGGDMAGRGRFAEEVVKAVRAATGPEFAIILRYSQWKGVDFDARLAESPQELEQLLRPLCDAGVDIFHASTRRFWVPEFDDSELGLAGWTRKLTGRPTIAVGSVGLDSEFFGSFVGVGSNKVGLERLTERMRRDEFDLVAIGRALLQDPQWVRKVHSGRNDELMDYDGGALKTYY